jgi:hypothetical protein
MEEIFVVNKNNCPACEKPISMGFEACLKVPKPLPN